MAKLRRQAYYMLLWLIALVFFAPVFWIFLSSLKTTDQLLAKTPQIFFSPTTANLLDAVNRPSFTQQFVHSLVLSVASVTIAIVVAFLAAYSFSRFRLAGSDFLMFLLLSVRMVPAAATIVPLYLMYAAFGWKDNLIGIILFYAMFSIPFSLWILKGFLDGVSQRFDETALMSGASRLQVMFKIILPQVRPGLIAAFIFNFIFVWNEYLFNYIVGGANSNNVPVGIATGMYSSGGVDWTFIASSTTIYMLPIIVMIYFFQKYLLIGMTFGTVRGEV
jgi:multiple sugar transport system permease protein